MKAKTRLLMSLKIWMVIYPSITLFYFLFGQHLANLPLYQRTFVLTISLVPWMMFIGVPFLDFLLRRLRRDAVKQK
jgi:antibiotic biosynthesis monooxygenase (ABM) superfamily enzyme